MNIPEISAKLRQHGLPDTLPVMAIASATTPREKRLVSTLDMIEQDVAKADLKAPVLFVIGHVVSLYGENAAAIPVHDMVAAYA